LTDLPDLETLLRELNEAAQGVARASNQLQRLTTGLENAVDLQGVLTLGAGARYRIALEEALIAVYEATDKPPAADIRMAMARRRLRETAPDLVAEYDRLTTEVKAAQQWIAANKQVISAKQSVLNGVRALGA
jgi:glutathione S-transferase